MYIISSMGGAEIARLDEEDLRYDLIPIVSEHTFVTITKQPGCHRCNIYAVSGGPRHTCSHAGEIGHSPTHCTASACY